VRLGRVTALQLARRGASVAFSWNSSEEAAGRTLAELEAETARHGSRALALRCDVRSEEQVVAMVRRVDEELGGLDLLVNNAAIFERTPVETITLEQWQRHLDVNLTGSFLCAREAGRLMASRDGGVIVDIACAGGLRPWAGHLAYCVSKAGVIMMTQVLARALAPKVRVNAIAPGPVMMPEDYDAAQRERAVEQTVLKRPGRPEDVARAVLFCWDSDYTTGALIPVEGGRLIL
jgi:pteridine reductase